MSDREKSSSAVSELCKKLKFQLEELGIEIQERARDQEDPEEVRHRQELFNTLKDQLQDFSG